MRLILTVVGLMIGSLFHTLSAQELDFPPDVFDTPTHQGHCIDVTTYAGVDKTGATDSTAGIQQAISDLSTENTDTSRDQTIYFPNGTYSISKTLDGIWTRNTTGNTSNGLKTITNLPSTTNIKVGNAIGCTDFATGTTVSSVDSGTQITVSNAATGTHTGIAIAYQGLIYRLHFVGQSEAGVTIKLGNSSANFQGSATAMIETENLNGTGGDAFDNCIWNMTLDTGTNNPGAVGIQYRANNIGSIRNVTIKATGTASGTVGLQLTNAFPGPCMIQNVEVDGFATGVSVGQVEYGITFEGLTLNNQRTVGINNGGNALYIRHMTSSNSNPVPVISNGNGSLLVLIDSIATYTGGGTTTANAINNVSSGTNCGGAFVRNCTTSNYALAVSNPNTGGSNTTGNAPNGTVTEYSTHAVLTPGLPGSGTASLNLPIQETPQFVDNNFTNWYSVGLKTLPDQPLVNNKPVDQSVQIQAAIDAAATAGKTTLYFPPGKYYLINSVTIHGSIRRVLGFGAYLLPYAVSGGGGTFGSGNASNLQPVISVGSVTGSLEMDYLGVTPTTLGLGTVNFIAIQQNTTQTLTLRDFNIVTTTGTATTASYEGSPGVGNLFLDDVEGAIWNFTNPGQLIWARQMDSEGNTLGKGTAFGAKVTNTGSSLWILGLKTEGFGTLVESTAGAATEVLGAFCYPVHTAAPPLSDNLFDVQNSDFSACYVTNGTPDYPNQVGETNGIQTGTLLAYGSTGTPQAYLRKQASTNASMAPLVVAAQTLIPGIDIGTVGMTGIGSLSGGVFTVTGAGAGTSTADAFHLCSESVAGDCTLTAEITSLPYISPSTRGGVMIRETAAPGSAMAWCAIVDTTTTSKVAYFIVRTTTGGGVIQATQSVTLPYWLRLQRSGNSFTGFISPDGTTWTQLGLVRTFTMASPALVGLGVTSGTTTALCSGTFTNLILTSP